MWPPFTPASLIEVAKAATAPDFCVKNLLDSGMHSKVDNAHGATQYN
jgi:hypothetical protein